MAELLYLKVRKVREYSNGNYRIDFDWKNTDGNRYAFQWNIPREVIDTSVIKRRVIND